MKQSILILAFLLTQFVYSQKGSLKGFIVDNTGDTLPYASVIVYIGDSLVNGAQADMHGQYFFPKLSPGTYNIKFSSVGLEQQIASGVIISANKTTYLDAILNGPVELKEIEIRTYKALHVDASYSTVTMDAVSISSYTTSEKTHSRKTKKSKSDKLMLGYSSDATVITEGTPGRYGDVIGEGDDAEIISDAKKIKVDNGTKGNGGLLTAGEISDFSKWDDWNKLITGDFSDHVNSTSTNHGKRFTVLIQNNQQNPLPFATVKLFSNHMLIFQTISDNTGKAELFTGLSDVKTDRYQIEVAYKNKTTRIESPTEFKSGINNCILDLECGEKKHGLEIAFVVDATGSMDDEIAYLKDDMIDILQKSQKNIDGELRVASVFYRDQGDEYVTRQSDFTTDLKNASDFVKTQYAGGGGDFPEAVPEGLEAAINLDWSNEENTKIIFLLLDAPPHSDSKSFESIKKTMIEAAARGIRIVPVICSGADKQLEYLMRTAAIITNGTYTFLTDHSGIGGTHMKPSTDEYEVYTLNQLMVNVIDRFTIMPKCEQALDTIPLTVDHLSYLTRDENPSIPIDIGTQGDEKKDSIQTKKELEVTVAPNPFDEQTTLMLSLDVTGKIYVYDMNGKILEMIDIKNERNYLLDMSIYSKGTYYLILEHQDKRVVKKIIKN